MYESYGKNERVAAEMNNRRGRLVGKGGGAEEAYATGEVMCASCGQMVDASWTIVTGRGPICEPCHFSAESPSVTQSVWWRVAGAVG